MAPITKGGKGKRSKKDLLPESEKICKNVDPSHGHGAVAVRLLHNVCSSISVQFTRRQPRNSCTGAVQLSQEPTIILSYNFSCLNDHLKSCVARRIRVQLLCSASTGIVLPATCTQAKGLRFFKFVVVQC